MKTIGILGSTGSIGEQALEVVRQFEDEFEVKALSANTSRDQLAEQADEFQPEIVALANTELDTPSSWIRGSEALQKIAQMDLDLLVLAIVGAAGVKPCLKAIETGTNIAFANKEVLVTAGEVVRMKLENSSSRLIPVDSEHSALFQLIKHEDPDDIKRLILTASGGPFLDYSLQDLDDVTPEEALDHPNWDMGPKITIDSATMMNKGFEVIEALYLFDLPPEKVEAVVHPQSMIHGFAELKDHSLKAHCSNPDMKLAIQYALFHPSRREPVIDSVSFSPEQNWEFRPIDRERFPCYELALEAADRGSTAPAVVNASNEVAVQAFLEQEIDFLEIPKLIEQSMNKLPESKHVNLEKVMKADREARKITKKAIYSDE